MSWQRVRLLAVLAIATGFVVAIPNPAAAQVASQPPQPAGCAAAIINQTGTTSGGVFTEYNNPLEMNHEGRTERSGDLVIYSANPSATLQTCFLDGNTIDVRFPEVLTNADGTSYGLNGAAAAATLGNQAPGVSLPSGAFHVNDPNSTLSVTVTAFTVTTSSNAGDGTTGTDIRISVTNGTTKGSTCTSATSPTGWATSCTTTPYIVLQNLRFDVVPMANGSAITSAGNPFDATVSVFGPDDVIAALEGIDTSTFDPVLQVGTVRNTIFLRSG